ncbi:hypothetical protein HKD37_14G038945 [Glycine soja]
MGSKQEQRLKISMVTKVEHKQRKQGKFSISGKPNQNELQIENRWQRQVRIEGDRLIGVSHEEKGERLGQIYNLFPTSS